MGRVLIIGAGGVGTVVAHKMASNPDVFSEIESKRGYHIMSFLLMNKKIFVILNLMNHQFRFSDNNHKNGS